MELMEGGLPPVTVAVVGCGQVSDQYLEGCARFEILRVGACADVDVTRARATAERYHVPVACSPE
jgi:predicted dehydrogenase